ncbi:MAG: GAF domain-containing sensor histidine kinase [Patescibacteria group bacterium]
MSSALVLSAIFGLLFVAALLAVTFLHFALEKRKLEIQKEKNRSARQLYELSILKEIGERVGYSLDIEEILRIITNSLRQFIDYTAVGFVVVYEKQLKLNVHFDKGASHSFFVDMKKRMLASMQAITGEDYQKIPLEESITGAIETESGAFRIGSFFNIPLVIGGKLSGVLTVTHEKEGLYKEEDMTILYKITSQASAAVERLQKVINREQERIDKVREEYTSIIVHELRSPLDGIRKICELVVSGKLKSAEEIQEYVTMAYQSSGRMMELINDILDLSKLQAGKFELNKSNSNILELLTNRFIFYKVSSDMAKIELTSVTDEALPKEMPFDKEAVKQMIGNLLSNAVKFTSPGGQIVLSAFVIKPDKPLPEIVSKINMPVLPKAQDIKVNTSSICVMVSDNGCGVSERVLATLFKNYAQAKSGATEGGQKGTGLGLSIVKRMSEAHGGLAGAVSKDGFGSSFFFTLPI